MLLESASNPNPALSCSTTEEDSSLYNQFLQDLPAGTAAVTAGALLDMPAGMQAATTGMDAPPTLTFGDPFQQAGRFPTVHDVAAAPTWRNPYTPTMRREELVSFAQPLVPKLSALDFDRGVSSQSFRKTAEKNSHSCSESPFLEDPPKPHGDRSCNLLKLCPQSCICGVTAICSKCASQSKS